MSVDTLIAVGKVAGAILSGVLGVAGILFDFKGPTGKLIKNGVAVLVGILVSAGVAILSSVAEGYKAKEDVADQIARTENLLGQSGRRRPSPRLK